MNGKSFLDAIDGRGVLVADGAMGTLLNARGVAFEQCFDELNLSDPALVGSIHKEYIQAGAEVIKTNTFGANRFKLARHGSGGSGLEAINRAGVELAKTGSDRLGSGSFHCRGYRTAGSTSGAIRARSSRRKRVEAFTEQAAALYQSRG